MLSGILYCADCNAKLYGNKSAVSSYRCPDSFRDATKKANSISSAGLDIVIKGIAKKIISDKSLLQDLTTKPVVNLEFISAISRSPGNLLLKYLLTELIVSKITC